MTEINQNFEATDKDSSKANFGEKLARFVSVFLHPIFIPIIFIFILLLSDYYMNNLLQENALKVIALSVAFFTLLIPILMFFIAKALNVINSFEMETLRERRIGIAVIIVSAYFSWRMLKNFYLQDYYTDFLIVLIIACIICFIVNFFFKVSIHVFSWSTAIVLLFVYSALWKSIAMPLIPAFVLITGLVAWARLKIKAHSYAEIYIGFALGLLPPFVLFFI